MACLASLEMPAGYVLLHTSTYILNVCTVCIDVFYLSTCVNILYSKDKE